MQVNALCLKYKFKPPQSPSQKSGSACLLLGSCQCLSTYIYFYNVIYIYNITIYTLLNQNNSHSVKRI